MGVRNLADLIEQYLERLLAASPEGMLEIQRSDLAERFGCAPSQINYVLETRFSYAQGYLVESRRGSGGYLRIVKLPPEASRLVRLALDHLGSAISQAAAERYICKLRAAGVISEREARLMMAAVRRESLGVELPLRDMVRARVLRAMLLALAGSFERDGKGCEAGAVPGVW